MRKRVLRRQRRLRRPVREPVGPPEQHPLRLRATSTAAAEPPRRRLLLPATAPAATMRPRRRLRALGLLGVAGPHAATSSASASAQRPVPSHVVMLGAAVRSAAETQDAQLTRALHTRTAHGSSGGSEDGEHAAAGSSGLRCATLRGARDDGA